MSQHIREAEETATEFLESRIAGDINYLIFQKFINHIYGDDIQLRIQNKETSVGEEAATFYAGLRAASCIPGISLAMVDCDEEDVITLINQLRDEEL